MRAIYILFLAFLIGLYGVSPEGMNKHTMAFLLLVAGLVVVIFIFKKERNSNLKGQYLKHSTLVLIGIAIVFFQFPLDFVLGNINSSNLFIWVDKKIVVKGLVLSVIGLICFLLGYLSFIQRSIKRNLRVEKPICVNFLNILSTVCLLVYFLTANPLYFTGFYGSVELGATATYAIVFFQLCIFAAVIQKCRNMVLLGYIPQTAGQYIKMIGWPLILLIIIYLLSVVFSGDRGPIIYYSILLFSGYFYITGRRLKWKYGLIFLFIGASAIMVLGLARSLNKKLSFTEKITRSINYNELGKINSILPQTIELAGSIKTLNTAIDYVPSKHEFLFGRFQLQNLASILPFFSNFTPLLFQDRSYKYQSSANFITWITQGEYHTYGNGTSVVADFYLDFGLIGVIFGMFLFGYLMRLAEVSFYSNDMPSLFIQTFSVVYLCYAIYIARSSFLLQLKFVVWIYWLLILNSYFFSKIKFRMKL